MTDPSATQCFKVWFTPGARLGLHAPQLQRGPHESINNNVDDAHACEAPDSLDCAPSTSAGHCIHHFVLWSLSVLTKMYFYKQQLCCLSVQRNESEMYNIKIKMLSKHQLRAQVAARCPQVFTSQASSRSGEIRSRPRCRRGAAPAQLGAPLQRTRRLNGRSDLRRSQRSASIQ